MNDIINGMQSTIELIKESISDNEKCIFKHNKSIDNITKDIEEKFAMIIGYENSIKQIRNKT